MTKIDICLAVFNNLKWTQKFIDSVYQSTYSDFDLVITDNGSQDNTIDWLESLGLKNLKIIKLKENYGCACGWNEALKKGENDFRVLTQNDIQFSKNWDKYLIDFLKENDDYYAAGSQEIENIDLQQEELNTLADCFKNDVISYNSFYIPCIMFKKEIFDIVGWFDENFKTGTYEDSDFIERCIQNDVKFAQIFNSIVCHVFGQTSRQCARADINKKYFEEKWDGKERKTVPIFYNKIGYDDIYRSGKIKNDIIKKELENLNIPYRWVR